MGISFSDLTYYMQAAIPPDMEMTYKNKQVYDNIVISR
jgi:hypothetical protein